MPCCRFHIRRVILNLWFKIVFISGVFQSGYVGILSDSIANMECMLMI